MRCATRLATICSHRRVALVVIDYRPWQVGDVRSIDPGLLVRNIVSTVKTAERIRPADPALDRQRYIRPPAGRLFQNSRG